MGNELRKEVFVVDGMPSSKAVIKFTEDETWYEISQKVQGYDLVKYGIVKGASVDVTFDAGNQVVYLKKKAGATAQEASAPVTTAGDTKTWTVKAVAKNKKVIKFEESAKDWDVVSPEIEALDLTALGIVPKVKVLVTFDGKDVVTAISKATEEPAATETSTQSSIGGISSQNTTNTSIENQVCLKGAVEIVKTLIERGVESVNNTDKIKNLLKDITKTCIESLNQ